MRAAIAGVRVAGVKLFPFAVAGLATAVVLLPFARREAVVNYLLLGGPALVFSLILIAVTRRSLSRGRMAALVMVSLLAYWAGVVFFLRASAHARDSLPAVACLAPGVGAGLLLAGLRLHC